MLHLHPIFINGFVYFVPMISPENLRMIACQLLMLARFTHATKRDSLRIINPPRGVSRERISETIMLSHVLTLHQEAAKKHQ
jgi:hypothetical protein